MALSSTIYRFTIDLSDIDRGIYETLSLRVAMHPSEGIPYLLTRLIAYALNVQEGIEFTGGINTPDEPAIQVKDLTGANLLWIDIGTPSAKRMHKASKASKAVRVYTYRDPELLMAEAKGQGIYRASEIEVYALPPAFLNRVGETIDRDNAWNFLHTGGELTITVRDVVAQGELKSYRLPT